jgi:hypothetical protein
VPVVKIVVAAAKDRSEAVEVSNSKVKVKDKVNVNTSNNLPVPEPVAIANKPSLVAAPAKEEIVEGSKNEAIVAVVFNNSAFSKEIFQTFTIKVPFEDAVALDAVAAAVFTVR